MSARRDFVIGLAVLALLVLWLAVFAAISIGGVLFLIRLAMLISWLGSGVD